MAPSDIARAYIYRLCQQVGVNADSVYNARTGAWYFTSGASTIEVFLTTTGSVPQSERTFLRCFSPIYNLPTDPVKKFMVLETAMTINTEKMGIKLGSLAEKGLLCVITERDVEGMDYNEFMSIIGDISYWSDQLHKFFDEKYG
jgi:hypothetical protein